MKNVKIITEEPAVALLAQMSIVKSGVDAMTEWVASHRPECLPDEGRHFTALFPHDMRRSDGAVADGSLLSDNELLVELAGRKCYDSFGLKAGRRGNAEYVANMQSGDVPHASVLYHAKLSFFFAGVSRRVSHEFIRNYVGSDRNEEGSPSQESTRFTHHYGHFVAPPRYVGDALKMAFFERAMQRSYDDYLASIEHDVEAFKSENGGAEPKGMDRKRIYEAAAGLLAMQAETSWIWTTNPMALAKLVKERADAAADLEFQRLARKIARVACAACPNLFPQPHMSAYMPRKDAT